MRIEKRLEKLGIELPIIDETYYGTIYGKMKPHHRMGSWLCLSGQTPDLGDGTAFHPGVVGKDVSVEDAYQAARLTGLNCIAAIKNAVGDLDNVVFLARSLNFVTCAPGFTRPHEVASGLSDLFEEVFGPEIGIGCRATIGVTSLANNYCFESWVDLEVR